MVFKLKLPKPPSKSVPIGVVGVGAINSEVKPLLFDANRKGKVRKRLVLPLGGSMSDFEHALFSDPTHLRFVQVVLATQSVAPWSVAADYSLQFIAFIDMINDINQSTEFDKYLGSFTDIVKRLGSSWLDGDANNVSLGFTLLFDPADAILPIGYSQNQSMSIINQLNYKVSVDRVRRLSNKYRFEGNDLIIEYEI